MDSALKEVWLLLWGGWSKPRKGSQELGQFWKVVEAYVLGEEEDPNL